jgi:aspartate-semialdehyde dehydrogenase
MTALSSDWPAQKVAVVGATGVVGKEIIALLLERGVPFHHIYAVASSRSAGDILSVGEDSFDVLDIEAFDFAQTTLALFTATSDVSARFAPIAIEKGNKVVDNTPAFRQEPSVPLVIPEINGSELATKPTLVANPNCMATGMLMALNPLVQHFGVRRVMASTYQSVSGAGQKAMDELFDQTRGIYANTQPKPEAFCKQIAFNVIPQIGSFLDTGETDEEAKMRQEVARFFDVPLSVTAVRVPSFVGHCAAVTVDMDSVVHLDEIKEILRQQPGMVVIDHHVDGTYVTPIECAGEDGVYVSRLRVDPNNPNTLLFWVALDNLRKGAALNTAQIADNLL